ncbi:hypothetical protein LXL04_014004 [Taraxacum kok-saghyz]
MGAKREEKKRPNQHHVRNIMLIWKARCDRVFKRNRISPTIVADNVKSIVFTWLKHRKSKCSYNWVEWCNNPFIYLRV